MQNNQTMTDEDGPGSRNMLGLILTAILLIGCGLGLMMWDDRQDRAQVPVRTSSVP